MGKSLPANSTFHREGIQPRSSNIPKEPHRHISNIPTVVWRREADASIKNNVMRRGSALAVLVTILGGVLC